ncbi:helix-turn-helix domain-containing protein, partial [Enterococcus thailandicus]|uniref:helix-turn-helix domain-containing protein n=1 Tax=Enterococcus thailandicus TaxID=417368 RepID=UPI0022DEF1D9
MSDILFNRIKETAKRQKNMNVKEVGTALKLGENAIYSWKKSSPSIDKVEKVSDFLNVSTDYLLGR